MGCKHLSEVVKLLNNPQLYQPVKLDCGDYLNQRSQLDSGADLKDVKGQAHARRALEIAATGGHNLVLSIANNNKLLFNKTFTL